MAAPVVCFILFFSSVPPVHSFVLDPPAPSNRIALNNRLSTTIMTTIGYGETSFASLLERAAALWNQVGVGSRPDHDFFSFFAISQNVDPCSRDTISTVAFASANCGLAWGDTVGITLDKWLEWTNPDGSIVISDYETDILFNDTVPWNAYPGPLLEADTGVPGCCDSTSKLHDFLRVAIHELGHALGLGHPDEHGQNVVSIMSATESTSLHTIQPDDIAGAHAVNFDPAGTLTVGTPVPVQPAPNASTTDLSGMLTKLKYKIKTDGDVLVLKMTFTKLGMPLPDLCILGTVWLSRDASLDPTDLFVTERCIEELITTNTTIKFKLTGFQSLGGLFVIVSIDDENVVEETDERNNTIVEQIPQRESRRDTLLVAHDQDGLINVGGIIPNARIRIRGTVNAAGSQDVYRLKLKGGQSLELTLSHVVATNFDLLVSDGVTGTQLGTCVTDVAPEVCTFTFSGATLIDISIVPRTFTGTYSLEIVSTSLEGTEPPLTAVPSLALR